jgi:ribose transport system substrate-binding protein
MKRRVLGYTRLFLISLLIIAFSFIGCEKEQVKEEAVTEPVEKYLVGFAASYINDYEENAKNGFKEYWESLSDEGFSYKVAEVEKSGDVMETVEIVESLVSAGVDGIILFPVTSEALIETLNVAKKGGIKFGTVGTTLAIDKFAPNAPDFVVAGINYPPAYQAAEMAINKIGGKGNVVIITGTEGSDVADDRKEGFEDACAKFPDINIVYSDYVDWSQEPAYNVMSDLLSKYDKIDLVLACTDDAAFGAHEAAAAVGRADEILYTGWDSNSWFLERMVKDPTLFITIDTIGDTMAKTASSFMKDALTNPNFMRAYVELEYKVITLEEMKKLDKYQKYFE